MRSFPAARSRDLTVYVAKLLLEKGDPFQKIQQKSYANNHADDRKAYPYVCHHLHLASPWFEAQYNKYF